MTIQRHDTLLYKGEETIIYTQPLEKYFGTKDRPNFISFNESMIVRGYYAEWKIESGKLFLTHLKGNILLSDWTELEYGIRDLFQSEEQPIFAHWFTGNIVTPSEKDMSISIASTFRVFHQFAFVKGQLIHSANSKVDLVNIN